MKHTLASRVLITVLAVLLHPPVEGEAQALTEDALSVLDYREIGPTRQSGRFIDIAVDPRDDKVFYMATASGHLWKTENHGQSFEVLFDDQPVFSIGDVTLAPSNPDIVYVGSGEGNNSRSSYWGNGVYRSDDGGQTWRHLGLPESHHIGRIVVHPENPDHVYVAALGHLYSENEERGLYRTTDGGATWEKVLGPVVRDKHIGVVDVAMDPTNPDVLYAATFDKVRLPFTYDVGGPGSRVWKSTDGGDNWTQLEGGLPGGMLGRIGIDVYRRDPNIVYLTVENANKPDMSEEDRYAELMAHESSRGMIDGEVYRSDDAGATWRKLNPDTMSVGGGPAYYYGQIIVDPNDPDVVHVLSAASWGTTDGGATWERQPLGFGGDDHALWIDPDDSDHMILGYDHGMGVTWDGGEHWYHPDFQSLAQFYAVGIDMSRPYRVAGGLQDNGSHMAYHTNPAGGPMPFEMWERVGGGDGMYNEFDWCTGRYLYNESQFGPIQRVDLWTGDSESIRHDDDELRWNWNAPILVSPHDCSTIFHASNKLLKSENRGESWEVISPDLSKADPATLTTGKGGDGNIQYATITTIDQSILDEDVIWAGTDDGNVQVTQNGGDDWTLVSGDMPGHPGYWVSRVEASKHAPGRAYASVTGYRNDDFRALVWRTDDYGATWTDISSNLPDEPINVVREHPDNPDLLFVGTEFRVWVSNDRGRTWTRMQNDMPVNPVHDMKIHPRENDLVVATHGRGLYIADLAPLPEMTPATLAKAAHLFEPESKVRWIADDRGNWSSSNFEGESEPMGVQLYYWLGSAPAGDVELRVMRGDVEYARFEGEGEAGLHEVVWNMDRREERTEEEIQQMVERFARFGRDVDPTDPQVRYTSEEAPFGEYTVVMTVGGREVGRQRVSVLKDEWWMERR